MEHLRTIMAAAALAAGVLLMLRAWTRRSSARGQSPAPSLIYAALFFVAAGWLFYRADEPVVILDRTEVPRETATEKKTSLPKATETAPDGRPRSATQDRSATDAQGTAAHAGAQEAPSDLTEELPPPPRTQAKPRRAKPQPAHDPARPRAEYVIETAVLSAFDWIESFFARYGAPATANAGQSAQIDFSALPIQFYAGTSDLNPRSRKFLADIVPLVLQQHPRGSVEIRAHADARGMPEAFRFMLSQARAESVRDVLVAGGFPPERVTARGSETFSEPARVEFVHRP